MHIFAVVSTDVAAGIRRLLLPLLPILFYCSRILAFGLPKVWLLLLQLVFATHVALGFFPAILFHFFPALFTN